MERRATSLFLVGFLFFGPASASADATFEAARAQFEDGVQHLAAGELESAASAFEQSLALRDSPKVRYNLGLTCRHLERTSCAKTHLTHFIEHAQEDEAIVGRAWSLLTEIDSDISLLELRLEGAPDRVTLDDTPIDGLNHALLRRIVSVAEHVVVAHKAGYEPEQTTITTTGGAHAILRLRAGVRPAPARLHVDVAHPADAAVVLGGRVIANGSYEGTMQPGVYELEVRADGHVARRFRLELFAGRSEQVRIALDREDDGSIASTWWFWTIVGVVAVGAAVGTYAATRPPAPDGGNLGRVVEAIHAQ